VLLNKEADGTLSHSPLNVMLLLRSFLSWQYLVKSTTMCSPKTSTWWSVLNSFTECQCCFYSLLSSCVHLSYSNFCWFM